MFTGNGLRQDKSPGPGTIAPCAPLGAAKAEPIPAADKQPDIDGIHLQPHKFVNIALADFGKNGPIKTMGLGVPSLALMQAASSRDTGPELLMTLTGKEIVQGERICVGGADDGALSGVIVQDFAPLGRKPEVRMNLENVRGRSFAQDGSTESAGPGSGT